MVYIFLFYGRKVAMWIIMAVMSALFAGVTSIFAKVGIKKTSSNVAMAIRVVVILIFSLLIVLLSGAYKDIWAITYTSFVFLILSGVVTGLSWIFYFKALSLGDVNKVVAIDKTSIVLSVLFAIILFNETTDLLFKLIGIMLILFGTILMLEKKKRVDTHNKSYIFYAILSAIFASLTSVLGKFGINNIDSNLGTFIRTIVILLISWAIVFATKEYKQIPQISRRELLFICLSGVSTGASWLCYYYAIKHGILSLVIPIDKLSIVISIVLSWLILKEKISRKALIGLILIVLGTLTMTII